MLCRGLLLFPVHCPSLRGAGALVHGRAGGACRRRHCSCSGRRCLLVRDLGGYRWEVGESHTPMLDDLLYVGRGCREAVPPRRRDTDHLLMDLETSAVQECAPRARVRASRDGSETARSPSWGRPLLKGPNQLVPFRLHRLHLLRLRDGGGGWLCRRHRR